ncbi:hypothetical protein NDU88_001386 [Pleurodeles waltl]|uniref:Uncharacterized protein n=1 Tax=Pleurodeles waltl TaxID=8319 RepID=A0AAV7L9M8_PLEWA|nr:hypothetical protein NDU88_001386 [Pleurodeles waltl]
MIWANGEVPGGTVESIACIRQDVNDNKQEEEAWRGEWKEGREDVDGQAEESTHRSREEDALDCKGSAGRQQTARTNEEEILENSTPTEVKTDKGCRLQSWNLVAFHIRRGTWLE